MKAELITGKIEKIGDEYLIAKIPVKMPTALAHLIARLLPWFIGLGLLIAFPLLFLGITLGASMWLVGSSFDSVFRPLYYLSLLVLTVELIICARALPMLLKRRLAGWRLVFYVMLIHICYALLRFVSEPAATYSLVSSLVLSAVWLYVLFQIKFIYTNK